MEIPTVCLCLIIDLKLIYYLIYQQKLNQLCLNNWNHGYIAEGDNDNSTNLSSLPLSITQISNIEIPTIQSRANSSSYNDEG